MTTTVKGHPLFGHRLRRHGRMMTFQDIIVTIGFSARIKTWSSAPDILACEGLRLRRYPRLLFANAVNVEDIVGRATRTFGGVVKEGRAESSSKPQKLL